METHLADWIAHTPAGEEAESILRRCVHCGFCTATCPTYQLLGDELDGPRGRIYLMKQMLEGDEVTQETLLHLDRCLTCRSCETTCPSGVNYGRLVDIGREVVETRVRRPVLQRIARLLLREGLSSPLFGPAYRLGQLFRPLLPRVLAQKIVSGAREGLLPTQRHSRKVILLRGCVQPNMLPGIDGATRRVLDRLGLSCLSVDGSGCCGAVRQHLSDASGALRQAKANIDAWWPLVGSGEVEAILVNASGCTLMAKDYGHLLAHDAAYADRARRISDLVRDPIELLEPFLPQIQQQLAQRNRSEPRTATRVAYHPPCTQQHGLKIRGAVERFLAALGAQPLPVADSHLCCGSAGTYSVLQPGIAKALREQKLKALQAQKPERILSANVGCIAHLAAEARVPVQHWLEWLDERLT